MQITRIFSYVLLAVAAGACSSSSSKAGPVVDDFDAPDTVAVSTVNGQQGYVLVGNLNFHDDAENVSSFTAHVTDPAATVQDATIPFPNPPGPVAKGPLQVTLGIPQGGPLVAGKTVSYEVSVTSVSGIISAPLSKTVTLQ